MIYPKQSQKPTAINHCFNCYHGRMALILELWDRDLRHLFPASCFACACRIRWVGWCCHYFKELRWWKFHFPTFVCLLFVGHSCLLRGEILLNAQENFIHKIFAENGNHPPIYGWDDMNIPTQVALQLQDQPLQRSRLRFRWAWKALARKPQTHCAWHWSDSPKKHLGEFFEFGIWNRKTSKSNIFVQNMLCEINGLQKSWSVSEFKATCSQNAEWNSRVVLWQKRSPQSTCGKFQMLHFPSPFSGGEGLLGHSSSRCTFLGWCSMFERFTRIGHRWRSLKGLIFLKCRYEPWDFDNEVLEFLLLESWCAVLPIRLVASPSGIGIKIVTYAHIGKIRNPLNLQNTKKHQSRPLTQQLSTVLCSPYFVFFVNFQEFDLNRNRYIENFREISSQIVLCVIVRVSFSIHFQKLNKWVIGLRW